MIDFDILMLIVLGIICVFLFLPMFIITFLSLLCLIRDAWKDLVGKNKGEGECK